MKTFKNQKSDILILTRTNSSSHENLYNKKLNKICIYFTTIYQEYKNVMEDFMDMFTPIESNNNDNKNDKIFDSGIENILVENKYSLAEEEEEKDTNDYYSFDVKKNIYLFIDM